MYVVSALIGEGYENYKLMCNRWSTKSLLTEHEAFLVILVSFEPDSKCDKYYQGQNLT